MTIKKSTEILLNQKKKLGIENLRQDTWLTQTSSFIKDFFGETSNEYNYIKDFKFYSKTFDSMSAEYDTNAHINKNSKAASQFIDNCIDTLKHKGLYKAPKSNFLQRFNDNALWASISIILPAICGFGFLIGQYTSDIKNFDLRQENKTLKDSLSILRPLTNKITDKRMDTIIQKAIPHDQLK